MLLSQIRPGIISRLKPPQSRFLSTAMAKLPSLPLTGVQTVYAGEENVIIPSVKILKIIKIHIKTKIKQGNPHP